MSVLNTNLLNRKQFPFLIANQKTAAGSREVTRLREILDRKKAKRWDKKVSSRPICFLLLENFWDGFFYIFEHFVVGSLNSLRHVIGKMDQNLHNVEGSVKYPLLLTH